MLIVSHKICSLVMWSPYSPYGTRKTKAMYFVGHLWSVFHDAQPAHLVQVMTILCINIHEPQLQEVFLIHILQVGHDLLQCQRQYEDSRVITCTLHNEGHSIGL